MSSTSPLLSFLILMVSGWVHRHQLIAWTNFAVDRWHGFDVSCGVPHLRTPRNLGLRRFSSMIASMSSAEGPVGPGLRRRKEEEKSGEP
jgi:hypothetical protein